MFSHLFKSVFFVPLECFEVFHKKVFLCLFLGTTTPCNVASLSVSSSSCLWIAYVNGSLTGWWDAYYRGYHAVMLHLPTFPSLSTSCVCACIYSLGGSTAE